MSNGYSIDGGEAGPRTSRRSAALLIVFTILLAWLLGFMAITMQPGYRGGSFVLVVLAGTALSLMGVMVTEATERRNGRKAKPRGSHPPPPRPLSHTESSLDVMQFARAVGFSLLLIGSIVLFGVYFGTPLVLFFVCRQHCRSGWGFAAVFGLVVGAAFPYVFARIVSIELWTGAIPEVIPAWLGGGLLPPV